MPNRRRRLPLPLCLALVLLAIGSGSEVAPDTAEALLLKRAQAEIAQAPAADAETVETLLLSAQEAHTAFREVGGGDQNAYDGALDRARMAMQRAFVTYDAHPALCTAEVAASIFELYEKSERMAADNLQRAQKKTKARQSLNNMLVKLCENAIGAHDKPALAKQWLVVLMRKAWDFHDADWLKYRAQLVQAGLLPEDYKNPDADGAAAHEEL